MTIEDETWAETAYDGYGLELDAHRNALDSVFFGIPTHPYIAGTDVLGAMAAEGLAVPPSEAVTIGGLPATQVRFEVPSGVGPAHGLEVGYLVLYGTPSGDVGIQIGDSARVIILNLGDRTLVVSIDAPSASEFALLDPIAEKLLQSVRFE
jgi:hypothetical protein